MTEGRFSQQVAEVLTLPTRAGTNWVTNPSIETNTTFWTQATSTISRVNEDAWSGGWSLKCVATGTAAGGALIGVDPTNGYPFVGGEVVSAKVRMKSVQVGKALLFHLGFRNAANSQLAIVTQRIVADGTWQEFSHQQIVAPANTHHVYLHCYWETAAVSDVLYIDGADFRVNEPGVDSYIDGSLGAGYTWTGVAHTTPSTRAETMATTSTRAAKNWCINPSFEVNVTGGWTVRAGSTLVRDTTKSWSGTASALLTTTAAATQGAYWSVAASTFGVALTGVAHTFDAKIRYWLPTGQTLARVQLQMNYSDASTDQTQVDLAPGNDQWQTLTLPKLTINPAKTMANFFFQFLSNATGAPTVAFAAYIDGLDIRLNEPDADAYVDGSLGPGYVWTGPVHGSASTRAAPWTGALPSTEPALQSSQMVAEVGTLLASAVAAQLSQVAVEVAIAAPPVVGRTQIVTIG